MSKYNNKMSDSGKLLIGAAMIAAVSAIGQYGMDSDMNAAQATAKWNQKYPNHQAIYVERLSNLSLFSVHTENNHLFTDEAMEEVIDGNRLVFSNDRFVSLEKMSARDGLNPSSMRNNMRYDSLTFDDASKSSSDVSKGLEVETPSSMDETKALVQQLKDELKNTLKKKKPDSAKQPSEKETSSFQSNVEKVNTDNIEEDNQYVYYGGTRINKVQYDEHGQLLSGEERRANIQDIFQNVMTRAGSWTIPYEAENEKLKIIVFSDPTCPYCQRMHRDIDRLNEAGISVYYMLYPRALINGSQDKSAQAVLSMMNTFWCSETPQQTMDSIYNHEYVEVGGECFAKAQGRTDFPVQEHFLLARMFNLIATPLTVLSDGRILYGYGGYSKFIDRVGEF